MRGVTPNRFRCKIAFHSSCAQSGTADSNCITLTALGTIVGSKGPGAIYPRDVCFPVDAPLF